jgi:hypothetical protein
LQTQARAEGRGNLEVVKAKATEESPNTKLEIKKATNQKGSSN